MDDDAAAATQGGLVGRDRPLATLAALLADARRGRGRSALVLGEPGIGKTALMRALADRAGADGLTTVWCWCTPGSPVPFATWRPLLRRLGLTDATPTAEPSHAAVHDRQRMFASILDGLESLTQTGPVLLVVEDAHWADEPSLALLRVVVATVPWLPICLVVTARDEPEDLPDGTARALAGLPSEVVRLTLEPLGGPDVARLLAQVTGRTADDPLAARVRERTGGNPFLVVEVGRGLTESSPESLPHGARELVSRRLRRLSTEARSALVAAAVVGDPIEVSLVAEVIERPESEVIDLLDAAGPGCWTGPGPGTPLWTRGRRATRPSSSCATSARLPSVGTAC